MTASAVQLSQSPLLLIAAFLVIFACGLGLFATLTMYSPGAQVSRNRVIPFIEHERDLAAALSIRPRIWFVGRGSATLVGLVLGLVSGIPLMVPVGFAAGFIGSRWAVSGRAASRRLKMERAFLGRIRDLRDRMSVSNQSLDTALQEIGRNPGPYLDYVLSPLARGGSVADNLTEAGIRSRSAIIEYACGVLLWSRTRSLDTLISAIDEILLEVGEAQLAVQEESLVTLTQQRAVTMAMAALMTVMFVSILRVDLFRTYYASIAGQVVLVVVLLMFAGLVGLLSILVRVPGWTRWNLKALQSEQDRLNA